MQTVQLDIRDDKLDTFLTIVKSLKDGIVENIRTKDDILDVESLEQKSSDYTDLQNIKAQNNQKYNLDEAKNLLGI
jgi:hypothetical protein